MTTALLTTGALAQPAPISESGSSVVQITASRFGETVQEMPLSISVVSGEEIRARGAADLRSALALLGGVSVAPGGDGGPAAAVPGLLGVREVDDLLLLVDGVPAASMFIPAFEAVSMVNVERIEVLRGAAPVYYGTTAFAGTINVIHYAAGKADSTLRAAYGSHGSVSASGSVVLAGTGYRQSATLDLSRDRNSDRRAGANSARGSWRGAGEVGGGNLRTDVNLMWQHQKPTSPTAIDQTQQLTAVLPVDYNANPADSKIDTRRQQFVAGYDLPLSFARWNTLLAYTDTRTDSVRAFLDLGDTPLPWSAATVADVEAFSQTLHQRELFVDSHITLQPLPGLDLTTGVNLLTGSAHADSQRFAYQYPFDGSVPPPAVGTLNRKTDVALRDERRLTGLYAQSRYKMTTEVSVLAGLRWNDTHEKRTERRVTTRNGAVALFDYEPQDTHRASGSVGVDWQPLRHGTGTLNDLTVYGSVGNTFQLSQVGFGPSPESRPEGTRLLSPETQKSFIYGVKGDALNGKLEFDVDGFLIDFDRQPVEALAGTTLVTRAQGQQRYKGVDFEGRFTPMAGLSFSGHVGWSDARYRDFVTAIDGTPTQLSGKQQVLTPHVSGGLGATYAPERGLRASLTLTHTGAHYLDELNEVRAPAYQVVDFSLGWRFDHFGLSLSGFNIGDKRPAVQASELGEGTFYRLPGRRFFVGFELPL